MSKGDSLYEADYSSIDNEILDYNSGLYAFCPNYLFIHETAISFKKFYHNENNVNQDHYKLLIDRLENLVQSVSIKIQNIKIIICNLENDNEMTLGNYFSKVPTSIDYQMKKYNDSLLDLSNKHNNLFLFDINQLIFHYGNPRDLRLFVTSDLHFSLSFSKKLVKSIFDFINVLNGNAIKCVIIDLDNTIWGGVIGDDGMDSIKIGYYGIGKAFTELQIFLKSLKERGIIICVCSKMMN